MADNTSTEETNNNLQTFAEFLESSPPNQSIDISDLITEKWIGAQQVDCLKTPEIQLHCPEESCNGIRFHRCTKNTIAFGEGKKEQLYLSYVCSNCQKSFKIFSLTASRNGFSNTGILYKFGEFPIFGPPTAARLLKLIGPDRDTFLKGRRCENQGLGIGAFVYYRRVVENQKNRILKEILKVLERLDANPEKIATLNNAIDETQFKSFGNSKTSHSRKPTN